LKIKCRDCTGQINIQDNASEGDIVQCPDCKRDFEIFRKEGSKIQLMRFESFDLSNISDFNKEEDFE
jgi:hypothetical protein